MSEWNEIEEVAPVYKVYIGDNGDKEFVGEITAEDVKGVARDAGIKQIGVRATGGAKLAPEDFPVQEDVIIFQVNKAG